jgi:hypothetical protein
MLVCSLVRDSTEAARQITEATSKSNVSANTDARFRSPGDGNSRLKGASWSKFDEFAYGFAAIRAAQVRRKIAPAICRAASLNCVHARNQILLFRACLIIF